MEDNQTPRQFYDYTPEETYILPVIFTGFVLRNSNVATFKCDSGS